MTKNITIGGLLLITMMLVLRPEPENLCTDDPNTVVIEYECNNLSEYENVPPEVTAECRARAVATTTRNKTKI